LTEPRRDQDPFQQPASDGTAAAGRHAPASRSAGPIAADTTAATRVSAAGREDGPVTEPPGLDPPDPDPPYTEWPEPEWPDPAWPGFAPGGRRPSYAFTLAASPWFKERYPDKAANLWDALHAGRAPQPAPAPDRLADREAGE
jgi:hypothetical protein